MGFWKTVDIDIREQMELNGTSYNEEKESSIRRVANELYGKKDKAKMD